MNNDPVIKGLGEVALRVNDLHRMADFYRNVIGLQEWRRLDYAVFYRIADGFAGHTRVFVLFDRSATDPESPHAPASTLDHFAFEIPVSAYESERSRLTNLGFDVRTRTFPDFKWRGLFLTDPEGNTVELVCYDETA
jgi:catechol-2,3-dioxygenase